MNVTRWMLLVTGAGFLLSGCSEGVGEGDGDSASGAVRRDSAGVQLVEYERLPFQLPQWEVAAKPDVRVGAVSGTGAAVFGSVNGVVQRSDGVIVVADGQARELRAFSSRGAHVWTAGRRGEGPGEFRHISSIWLLPGDSVMVVDGGRLSVFDSSGGYVRQFSVPPPTASDLSTIPARGLPERNLGSAEITGVLGDGSIAVAFMIPGAAGPDGRYRNSKYHALVTNVGDARAGLGEFASVEGARVSMQGVAPNGEAFENTTYTTLPMSRRTEVAVSGDRVAIADQAQFAISVFTNDGELMSIVRANVPPLRLDRARYEEFHRDRQCGAGGCWQDQALSDSLPAFGRLLPDSEGRIWIEEFVPEYEERIGAWWIIDRSGEFLARIRFPEGFAPLQIGKREVIGLTRNDLDVPFVERWTIATDP